MTLATIFTDKVNRCLNCIGAFSFQFLVYFALKGDNFCDFLFAFVNDETLPDGTHF